MKLVSKFNFVDKIQPAIGLRKLQDNIVPQLNQVLGIALLDGKLLTVDLDTATTNVEHGLGRAFRGWFPVDNTSFAVITRDDTSSADQSLFLPLVSTVALTAKIWVF